MRGGRILFVEETPRFAVAAGEMLVRGGFHVVRVRSLARASERLRAFGGASFRLVVIACNSPVCVCPQWHARLPAAARRIPLLLLRAAEAIGPWPGNGRAFLSPWPLDHEALLRRVSELLGPAALR